MEAEITYIWKVL